MDASKPQDQLANPGGETLAILPPYKVVAIEVLHLDEMGYGPAGEQTRRQWRSHCATAVTLGRREGIGKYTEQLSRSSGQAVSFAAIAHLEGGGAIPLLDDHCFLSTSLDVVGADFAPKAQAVRDEKLSVPFLAAGANISSPQFAALQFNAGASFRLAAFNEASDFSQCRFQEFADFSYATFKSGVTFKKAQFLCDAVLNHVVFGADALFALAQFNREARFDDSTFTGVAAFTPLHANGGLWFDRAKFNGDARFGDVNFPGIVRFAHATFVSSAVFNDAKFASGVSFDETTFVGAAQFDGATFDSEVSFAGSAFKDEAGFFRSKFRHRSDFEGVTFEGSANFQNGTFENVGHFIRVVFKAESPSFLGVAHKTALLFRGSTFPPPTGDDMEIEHYGALKALSEAQGHGAQSLEFNGLELAARRRSKSFHWLWRLTTWLYETSSHYGQSYLRPLGILASITSLTWAFAAGHAAINSPPTCLDEPKLWIGADLMRSRVPCDNTGYSHRVRMSDADESGEPLRLTGYRAATEYVLLGGLGIFEFPGKDRRIEPINMRLYGEPLEPWQMRAWGVFRGIASAALLFLIALGLRNSYRLK